MRYAEDSKERVRDAVDIVDLVSTRTELRRAGANSYFGRCPFHEERSPSFHVRPAEKVYYCFGCQASGDAFSFVMESDGTDFPGALELLAGRYGVTLEVADDNPVAAARRERRERLFALLERAAGYYERYLWETEEAAPARDYLRGRGLEEEVLRAFRVGFAPSAWDRMLLASRRGGFSEEELRAAGLASRSKKGSLYDRFRKRIMFPLADERGRVLGFGARALRENQPPKYLNSSDGEVYHKGSQLFGLHLARREAARSGSVVLAEGYTDVLALHQAGLRAAVGLMGTALTEEQVGILARSARTLELALDADRAGERAMLRAAELADKRDLTLRVVPLPDGADPADLLAAEGAEAMRERVGRSVPFVAFRVDRVLASAETGSAEGKDRALEELRPIVGSLGPSVMREELMRRIAGRLELSEKLVASLVGDSSAAGAARNGAPASERARGNGPARPRRPDRREEIERSFLALCLAMPEDGALVLARAGLEEHFSNDRARRAAAHLREHLEAPLAHVPEDDQELTAYLRALTVRFERESVGRASLEHAWLLLELARLQRAILAARRAESGEVAALAREREEVRRQIDEVSERIDRSGR